MKFFRYLLISVSALLALTMIWMIWNRPQQVDMAGYVPADSLVYVEANSLPDIASGIADTDAWKALAPPAGIRSGSGGIGWLSRLAAWTGIGPADVVVFSRAQVAATIMGIEASDGGEALRIKPRFALVIETHTGAGRARSALEKQVGDFARRAYGEPRVEQKEIDGVPWSIWSAASGERRIFLAMLESVAVAGNDETAVRACLAVRRGERPSLAGNLEMEEMRRRLTSTDALAFSYISREGGAKLFEVAAAYYVGQASQDSQTQSLAANILPQIARKIFGSIGWSTRLKSGMVEDSYFLKIENDAAARLRDALSAAPANWKAGELLPGNTSSITRYTTREPLTAWRALNLSISSQLDPVLAVMVSPVLKAALSPYGIEDPDRFMQMIGPEIITARVDDKGESTVTIVEVRDEKALREFVLKRLGTRPPQAERIGDAEMLSSKDEGRGAASFVAGHLLLGATQSVRRCLEARQQGQTLSTSRKFQQASQTATALGTAHAITLTEDAAPARSFISFIANQRAMRAQPTNEGELEKALNLLPYDIRQTQFVEGGIERKTSSAFGQLGAIATQFATGR